jgi:transcriptional regulator with XRE-family HTH domain
MSHLLKLIAYPEQQPSRSMTIKGQLQSRPLSQANEEALLLLGNQTQNVSDPHGQCLRQARLKQGKSPAELATLACISLAQLYELESGRNTLFYTPDFALQAKRRVARLLGEDWDIITTGPGCSAHTASNAHALSTIPSVAAPSQPIATVNSVDIEVTRLVSVSVDCELEPVKAQTAVIVTPPQTPKPEKAVSRGQSSWWWVLVLTVIAGVGTQWPVLAQILTNV